MTGRCCLLWGVAAMTRASSVTTLAPSILNSHSHLNTSFPYTLRIHSNFSKFLFPGSLTSLGFDCKSSAHHLRRRSCSPLYMFNTRLNMLQLGLGFMALWVRLPHGTTAPHVNCWLESKLLWFWPKFLPMRVCEAVNGGCNTWVFGTCVNNLDEFLAPAFSLAPVLTGTGILGSDEGNGRPISFSSLSLLICFSNK